MKNLKKIFALVLAVMMIAAMSVSAFATGNEVTITISRDNSYVTSADGNRSAASGDRVFTAYKVFDAEYTEATGDERSVSYKTSNAGLIAELKKDTNLWFDIKESTVSGTYVVAWKGENTVANVKAAAEWLKGTNALGNGEQLTWNSTSNSWSKDVTKGYYLIESSEGKNLIAATTDINITEKNTYPSIDKKEKDEDKTDFVDNTVDVAVGDVIDYKVSVTIPSDMNKDVVVVDTMSSGLSYYSASDDGKVALSGNLTANTDYTISNESTTGWTVTFKATDAVRSAGTVDITFKATVTSAALADTNKKNTVQLNYGNDHYQMTDYVEYKTYFTGIEKVDGNNNSVKLDGVKFTLKEGTTEFKVSKPEGKDYYVYDANGSSEVVTDSNGLIKIRGLDKDKTYTLTETETKTGYNLLDQAVTLNLTEDTSADIPTAASYVTVENNKGTLLPSTGGIGTTIFYVVGTVLVLGAGIVLVTRKRMGKN